jgi:hypothetical protein
LEIAKYVVGVGFSFPKAEIEKLDAILKSTESKLAAFSISKFKVNDTTLKMVLGTALDLASKQVTFEISKFAIDQSHLNATMARAINLATNSVHPVVNPHIVMGARATNAPTTSSKTARNAVAGGMIGGGLSRMYGPIAALALGGYGLSSLNKRNQAVQAAELTSEAVATSNGLTQEQGAGAFDWLKKLANKTGFSYMGAADQYNGFLANSLSTGSSLQQSQKMFKGIAEYSRVMHLTPYAQKLVFKGFTDMMGKGKVMSEELTKQLGNSLPGAKPIFAAAYQEFTGGKLTGQPAMAALLDAMKKGKVLSADIIPIATRMMEEKAAPTIAHASETSQSEEDRMTNSVNDLAVLANKAGVEEGFARIFRSISTGLDESGTLVTKLAEGFNEATIAASKLLLFPQSFERALDGRDSLVADWLGVDKTTQMIEDWSQIKVLFDDIAKAVGSTEWSPTLKSTADEIAQIMHGIAEFQVWKQRTGDTAQQINQDEFDAGGGSGLSQFKGLIRSNWHTFKNTIMPWSADERNAEYGAQKLADSGANTDPFMGESGLDTKAYWKYTQDQAKDYSLNQFGRNSYGVSLEESANTKSGADTFKQGDSQDKTNNTFYMEFHMSGEPAVMEDWFRTSLTKEIAKVMPNLPER